MKKYFDGPIQFRLQQYKKKWLTLTKETDNVFLEIVEKLQKSLSEEYLLTARFRIPVLRWLRNSLVYKTTTDEIDDILFKMYMSSYQTSNEYKFEDLEDEYPSAEDLLSEDLLSEIDAPVDGKSSEDPVDVLDKKNHIAELILTT